MEVTTAAYLSIWGDDAMDHSRISAIFKREPTRQHSLGDRKLGKPPERRSLWQVQSSLPESAKVSEHFEMLATTFAECAEEISEYCASNGLKLMFDAGISSYGEYNVECSLSAELVALLARYGASIWLDQYYFDEKPPVSSVDQG